MARSSFVQNLNQVNAPIGHIGASTLVHKGEWQVIVVESHLHVESAAPRQVSASCWGDSESHFACRLVNGSWRRYAGNLDGYVIVWFGDVAHIRPGAQSGSFA